MFSTSSNIRCGDDFLLMKEKLNHLTLNEDEVVTIPQKFTLIFYTIKGGINLSQREIFSIDGHILTPGFILLTKKKVCLMEKLLQIDYGIVVISRH